MDKFKTKKFLESFKIKSPKSVLLKKTNQIIEIKKLKFQIILKPVNGGSSVNMFILKNKKELTKKVLEKLLKKDKCFLIEEFIKGREFSVSLMGNSNKTKVLAITEIIPKLGEFYDYNSKYQENGSEHFCPAKVSKKLERQLKEKALEIYNLLGCKDLARVDFLINKKEEVFFIEVNTIPGMTQTSLVPEAAKASGMNFKTFLTKLVYSKK